MIVRRWSLYSTLLIPKRAAQPLYVSSPRFERNNRTLRWLVLRGAALGESLVQAENLILPEKWLLLGRRTLVWVRLPSMQPSVPITTIYQDLQHKEAIA